jgi:hypothetical protein
MAWYHVNSCDCPVGCCDCGEPSKPLKEYIYSYADGDLIVSKIPPHLVAFYIYSGDQGFCEKELVTLIGEL